MGLRGAVVERDEQVDVPRIGLDQPVVTDGPLRSRRRGEGQRHLQPVEVVVHRDERIGRESLADGLSPAGPKTRVQAERVLPQRLTQDDEAFRPVERPQVVDQV